MKTQGMFFRDIEDKDIIIYLPILIAFEDELWNISFRLHNASSKVEPSLKFDIQLVKTPINTGFHSIKIV